jgi:hypothetical protein
MKVTVVLVFGLVVVAEKMVFVPVKMNSYFLRAIVGGRSLVVV